MRTALPDFATLDDFMSAEAADRDFSGVRICSGPSVLFTGAYGPASRRWPMPVTEEMRFDVASVTRLSCARLRLGRHDPVRVLGHARRWSSSWSTV